MKMEKEKIGFTLVEMLMAVLLVSAAAAMLYQGMIYSYRTMMRSRAKLDAQGIAFDALWAHFNTKDFDDLMQTNLLFSTPANSIFSTNGFVRVYISPQRKAGILERWEMTSQVWAPSNSILFSIRSSAGVVTEYAKPLAEYSVIRYVGDRE